MQVFNRRISLGALKPKLFGLTVVAALLALVFIQASTASAAGETYSYAESGAKIVGKGGSFGSATATFTKGPIQSGGKDQYTSSVKISGNNGDCNIGLQILVSPGATSGTIAAPAFLNGLASAGSPGTAYTPSCDKAYAAGLGDFNKSISVSTSGSSNPAPTPTETEGQREIVATVYSDKKVSSLPEVRITQVKANTPNIPTAKVVSWNDAVNIGSARFSNVDPGSYKVCMTPDNLFSYTGGCQTVTKVAGSALLVNFGSSANNLNEEGKIVTVKVNLSIPAGTGTETYGPIGVTLFNSAKQPAGLASETQSEDVGEEGSVRDQGQVLDLTAKLDGVEPGDYIVCVTGTELCSPTFNKQPNIQTSTEINIAEDQAKQFLAGDGVGSCAIDGVGWIVCPVISFMATIADSAFSFLSDNFLSVDVNVVSTDGPAYQAWSIMRNFANVAFVITFLIIIFSQMTGQGIANYGIKKLLPRLVIAAILVNVSFIICQLAVDLSNVLGYSINQVFKSVGGGVVLPSGAVPGDESGNWVGIAAAVIAGGTIAWALGVSVLLPFLLGAVIALIMVFLILVVRQMLIILLIVVAPLAFVAFLLPNTEQWFAKWRKVFVALLLIFPIIGLLFGAAGLASTILKSVVYSAGDETGLIGQIVAAGIVALPLFLLPSILKGSLNSVGNIGSTINKLGERFSKGASSKAANTGLMKNYAARKAERRTAISNGTYKGANPISRLRTSANRGLNNSGIFNRVTSGYGAERTLSGQGQQRKDAQEAMAMFAGNDSLVEAWAASGGNFGKIPESITAEMTSDQKAQLKTQFTLMKNAGHDRKPTSFLAAAQYLSENGKGSATAVQQALKNASDAGASSVEVGSAGAAAVAAYRKSGRGDALAQLSNAVGLTGQNGTLPMTEEQGWAQVGPSAVHRDGIGMKSVIDPTTGKVVRDPVTGNVVKTKSDGLIAYENHLLAKPENTRQALAGYDSMEQRAREKAEKAILDAAIAHHAAAPGTTPAITNIREAKDYFGVK